MGWRESPWTPFGEALESVLEAAAGWREAGLDMLLERCVFVLLPLSNGARSLFDGPFSSWHPGGFQQIRELWGEEEPFYDINPAPCTLHPAPYTPNSNA